MNSDEARRRAAKLFKQEKRDRDTRKAFAEIEAGAQAVREKTIRLKALRLLRETQQNTKLDK